MDNFNALEKAALLRKISFDKARITRLENLLKGSGLTTVHFADASIDEAKIGSMSVDKLISGLLSITTEFNVGSGDNYLQMIGGDNQILMYNNGICQMVIGELNGSMTVRISLPGVDALTETDPDLFSLFIDESTDYILIKEKARGDSSVGAGGTTNVAHGLGYVPFCLVFWLSATGVYRKCHGADAASPTLPYFTVDDTNLALKNPSGASKTMAYYIFYDNIT